VRVIKHCENGIVRRVALIDDAGRDVVPVTRFLSHLMDANYSPNTVCAYAYDLRHLATFLDERHLGFGTSDRRQRWSSSATCGGSRAAVPLNAWAPTATSTLFEWAIAAEAYTGAGNPMQRQVDPVLGRVPDRPQPFLGGASRQQPVRRTVRVRLPVRLPRPIGEEDVQAVLDSLRTARDLAIFLLMLDGGLWPGEVLCLQLKDLAYGRRRVTIRGRWTRSAGTCCTSDRSRR
jgi:integrase/recombinase XerD